MSLCSIRLMPAPKREAFRNEVHRAAMDALKLFRTLQRIDAAFRCAMLFGTTEQMNIREFQTFCLQCRFSCRDTAESDRQDEECGATPSLYLENLKDDEMTRRLVAEQRRAIAVKHAGTTSRLIPLWRESAAAAADPFGPGGSSRFDITHSLGTGLQKRRMHSTVAAHNVLTALSTRSTAPMSLKPVTCQAINEGFGFVVQTGGDDCDKHQFTMLLIILARHFYRDLADEFGDIFAIDRLWDQHMKHFVDEYSANTLDELRERGPVTDHPGMSMVHHLFAKASKLSYALIGSGGPVALRDCVRFVGELRLMETFPHVAQQDVEDCFEFARQQYVPLSGESGGLGGSADATYRPVPDGCIDEECFFEFTAILSTACYNLEPARTETPTLSGKCYLFYKSVVGPWFYARSQHRLEDEIVPLPRELPQIVQLTPLVVPVNGNVKVLMDGKHCPTASLFVRFGKWIVVTEPMDLSTRQHTIVAPPVEAEHAEVVLYPDGGDMLCTVRRYTEVDVAVSTDGITFNPFVTPKRFTFETTDPPVSVLHSLAKFQKIFVFYASGGGSRPLDEYLTRQEWIQFCRDFRFLPPVSDPDGEAASQPFRNALQCFTKLSVEVREKSSIEGLAKPRMMKALPGISFAKCVLNLILLRGSTVEEGLKDILGNDQWLGREELPDVPEANTGPRALRVRRAAKGSTMARRPEGVGEQQPNSPRAGALPLSETAALQFAVDRELDVDIQSFPAGCWKNENEHARLIFRFLTTGDKDLVDDPNARSNALATLQYNSNKVTIRGPEEMVAEDTGPSAEQLARDAAAAAKDKAKLEISERIVINHRNNLNAACRRELNARERNARDMQRVQEELQKEKERSAKLEEEAKAAAKLNPTDAPMLHHGAKGVLQAEKEALHRVYVYELERRKAQLTAQSIRDENLRDIERNRVLKDMKDRLVDSDASFSRLQDLVIGQSETIERQAEVLRMLKDRTTVLTADVMYYRGAHQKLMTAVQADPANEGLANAVRQEQATHDASVDGVIAELRIAAKAEGKKGPSTMKELSKIQKQKSKQRGSDATPGSVTPPSVSLLAPPAIKVALSAEEAEEQIRLAVEEVTKEKDQELQAMEERMNALQERLAEYEDEDDDDFDQRLPTFSRRATEIVISDGEGDAQDKSIMSRSRASRRASRRVPTTEMEVQTDVDTDRDDDANQGGGPQELRHFGHFFNPDATVARHPIRSTDTFDSIAHKYGVEVDDLYAANFILPPSSESTPAEREAEMKLLLAGIATGELRVPVSDLETAQEIIRTLTPDQHQSRRGTFRLIHPTATERHTNSSSGRRDNNNNSKPLPLGVRTTSPTEIKSLSSSLPKSPMSSRTSSRSSTRPPPPATTVPSRHTGGAKKSPSGTPNVSSLALPRTPRGGDAVLEEEEDTPSLLNTPKINIPKPKNNKNEKDPLGSMPFAVSVLQTISSEPSTSHTPGDTSLSLLMDAAGQEGGKGSSGRGTASAKAGHMHHGSKAATLQQQQQQQQQTTAASSSSSRGAVVRDSVSAAASEVQSVLQHLAQQQRHPSEEGVGTATSLVDVLPGAMTLADMSADGVDTSAINLSFTDGHTSEHRAAAAPGATALSRSGRRQLQSPPSTVTLDLHELGDYATELLGVVSRPMSGTSPTPAGDDGEGGDASSQPHRQSIVPLPRRHRSFPQSTVLKKGRKEEQHPSHLTHHSPLLKDLSRLQHITDPDWIIGTAITAPSLLPTPHCTSLGARAQEEQDREALEHAVKHYEDAELLRRLFLVRDAQDFFQHCVRRFQELQARSSSLCDTAAGRMVSTRYLADGVASTAADGDNHPSTRHQHPHSNNKSQSLTSPLPIGLSPIPSSTEGRAEGSSSSAHLTTAQLQRAQAKARKQELDEVRRTSNQQLAQQSAAERRQLEEVVRLQREPRVLPRPRILTPIPLDTPLRGTAVPSSPTPNTTADGGANVTIASPSPASVLNLSLLRKSAGKLVPLIGGSADHLPASALHTLAVLAKTEAELEKAKGHVSHRKGR